MLTLPDDFILRASPGYLARAQQEACEIVPWIKQQFKASRLPLRILDIGCGLAAVDAFLCQMIPIDCVALLDGVGLGKKDVYTDGSFAWNDVNFGVEVVRANVSSKVDVGPVRMDQDFFPCVDVVLSLRSWCHHYPASVYLDRVRESLEPDGLLIVDCRKGRGNVEVLERSGFRKVVCIEESPKRERLIFEKA